MIVALSDQSGAGLAVCAAGSPGAPSNNARVRWPMIHIFFLLSKPDLIPTSYKSVLAPAAGPVVDHDESRTALIGLPQCGSLPVPNLVMVLHEGGDVVQPDHLYSRDAILRIYSSFNDVVL